MDNTTSPTTADPATPSAVTPFPASNATNDGPAVDTRNAGDGADGTPANRAEDGGGAAPLVDGLIKRAAAGAHAAIDSMAGKASSLNDGLHGGVSRVGATRDEWIESARDAIRQHPFAAVAGALLVGAALLSLGSSRRD
jgi:hypothetical protein